MTSKTEWKWLIIYAKTVLEQEVKTFLSKYDNSKLAGCIDFEMFMSRKITKSQ